MEGSGTRLVDCVWGFPSPPSPYNLYYNPSQYVNFTMNMFSGSERHS